MAAAQYDSIAEAYEATRSSPLRRHVEGFTLRRLLGDVRGRSVLDLGCGSGIWARELRASGATRVVGVDESPAMLDQARRGGQDPGIEYHLGRAQEISGLGRFDLVLGAYLLHYADDSDDLHQLCRAIAAHLRPDGRFVGLNENPDQAARACHAYPAAGFSKYVELPRRDGSEITYQMLAAGRLFSFDVRHFARLTYERALRDAGFMRIEWVGLALDPAGLAERPAAYWREYLDNPPVTAIHCALQP
ncbi:MAG: methyltransferase domain-containing protein [Chromatiales bacterium]|nr:methyltransferase domain-containing protein [Chromatiales bacterium]